MSRRPFGMNVLAISRAYSIPYLSVAGMAAMLLIPQPLSLKVILLDLLIPAAISVGLSSLNDALHARRDAVAGRGRDYSPQLLMNLGIGCTLAAFILAAWGGLWVFLGVLGTVVGGIVYGMVKDRPGLGNLLRGLTSIPLIIGLGALNGVTGSVWALALGVGLLDGAGNIWGDVRDAAYDKLAGVETLVVRAPRLAIWLALAMHVGAVALFSVYSSWIWLSLLGSAYVLLTTPHWQHRSFLMVKYVTVGWLAIVLSTTTLERALLVVLTALGAAIAWWAYTLIHRPKEEPVHAV